MESRGGALGTCICGYYDQEEVAFLATVKVGGDYARASSPLFFGSISRPTDICDLLVYVE
jgi:hypothetical protein